MGVNVFYIWHTPCRIQTKIRGGEEKKKFRKARGRKSGAVVQSDRCEWPTIYFDKKNPKFITRQIHF